MTLLAKSAPPSPLVGAFAEQFRARREAQPGGGPGWLAARRDAAIARFTEAGLPTTKVEAWKYTNLRTLDSLAVAAAGPESREVAVDRLPTLLEAAEGPRLVFVNGFLRADLSRTQGLPEAVTFGGLAEVLAGQPALVERALSDDDEDAPLLALNAALMEDGAVLQVPAGVTVERPLELVFLGTGGAEGAALACHPRLLIELGENTAATVVELHASLGDGVGFANIATDVALAQGARLRHVKLQDENRASVHLAALRARIERDASFESFGLALGGRLSRNEASVRLVGSGSHCRLGGAYLMGGTQHCDNTTTIEHMAPNTSCREVFKGALDGRSRGVFQGRIVVHKDAQQTDGHQLSRALLLSGEAEIDAKPELEIYADDVKCSHGATAGEIDHDALFYLRARGIPEARARSLLIEAFLAEAVEEGVADEALRPPLLARVSDWLGTPSER